MPAEMLERVETLAKAEERTISELVREARRQYEGLKRQNVTRARSQLKGRFGAPREPNERRYTGSARPNTIFFQAGHGIEMKRLQVLLAEDNEADVFLVHEALNANGIAYEMNVAADGAQACRYLELLGTDPSIPCPDVFLLDLNLPRSDGHELLTRFRAHPLCTRVPVIIVTSSDAPKDRERTKALGATRYFRKPSDLAEFLKLGQVVQDAINARPAQITPNASSER